uniref:Uncharacterized protein n=1 Tax=Anopheles arabiensis TaxID=7173 RepID=A0A182I6L9_ANOAR
MESLGVIQALLVVSAVVVVAEDLVEEMVAVYPAGDASVPVSVPGKVNQQTSLWNRPDKAAVEVRTMVDVRSVMQVCDVTVADATMLTGSLTRNTGYELIAVQLKSIHAVMGQSTGITNRSRFHQTNQEEQQETEPTQYNDRSIQCHDRERNHHL